MLEKLQYYHLHVVACRSSVFFISLVFLCSRKFSTDKFNDQQQLYSLITLNNSFLYMPFVLPLACVQPRAMFHSSWLFCTTILHLISIAQLIIHRKTFNILKTEISFSKTKYNRFALAFKSKLFFLCCIIYIFLLQNILCFQWKFQHDRKSWMEMELFSFSIYFIAWNNCIKTTA